MATALIRRSSNGSGTLVEIEVLARDAGLHPALVERLLRLGALEQEGPPFPRDAAAVLARCVRLHRDLGLNWAGAILAGELLARIDDLEARLSRYETTNHRPR
jgi:hypothetical protein